MIGFLLLMMAGLGADAEAPKDTPLNDARHANVVLLLHSNPELAEAHAGYWAALQARPEWLEREAVYWELLHTKDLGPLLINADEWLLEHDEMENLYQQAYEALAKGGDLRRNFELLERELLDLRGDPRSWMNLGNYLQFNPSEALQYLKGIDDQIEVPDALKPYALELYDAANWEAMRKPLEDLLKQADAAPVLEWWKKSIAAATQDDPLSRLGLHFVRRPNRFWAWHQRELALAAEPQLRDWVHWLHRRMRRERVPYTSYLLYLSALRTGQEAAPPAPAATWPPDAEPSQLVPLTKKAAKAAPKPDKPSVEKPSVSRPVEPARPEIRRPERPVLRESDLVTTPSE